MLKMTVKRVAHVFRLALERARCALKAGYDFIRARVAVGRAGGYVALAALIALLGAGTYALRSDVTAAEPEPVQPPRAALAVQNAAPTPRPSAEPELWGWPVEGEILSAYSDAPVWSQTLGQWETHPALDIAAAPGEAVYACRDGVVSDAWRDRLWGNVIVLDHGDGWQSTCAGLNTLNLVSVGDSVAKGDVISAAAPSLPCESDLPAHIHFMMTKDGVEVDPMDVLALPQTMRYNVREKEARGDTDAEALGEDHQKAAHRQAGDG